MTPFYRVIREGLLLGFVWHKPEADEWAGWFIVEPEARYSYVGPYPRREVVAERIAEMYRRGERAG